MNDNIKEMKSVLKDWKANLIRIEKVLEGHQKEVRRFIEMRDNTITEIGVLEIEIQLQEGTDTPETRIMD